MKEGWRAEREGEEVVVKFKCEGEEGEDQRPNKSEWKQRQK